MERQLNIGLWNFLLSSKLQIDLTVLIVQLPLMLSTFFHSLFVCLIALHQHSQLTFLNDPRQQVSSFLDRYIYDNIML